MNVINVIAPYKHLGMWVFDDPRVGLNQEPFVSGAGTMIDRVVADVPNADSGFTLIFAATPFPGHQYRLDWMRADEDGGNWYRSAELDMEGWLCPALFRYFDEAPKQLYAQVKRSRDGGSPPRLFDAWLDERFFARHGPPGRDDRSAWHRSKRLQSR
jgi:hypothetical protein